MHTYFTSEYYQLMTLQYARLMKRAERRIKAGQERYVDLALIEAGAHFLCEPTANAITAMSQMMEARI